MPPVRKLDIKVCTVVSYTGHPVDQTIFCTSSECQNKENDLGVLCAVFTIINATLQTVC